ncbi:MAG: hypothetical protein ACRD1F_10490 [Terriglobales bacterium]
MVAAIVMGLFAATMLTGVRIPVSAATIVVGAAQGAAFSVPAATSFAVLFGVPRRMAWGCMICGVASDTSRTLLFGAWIDRNGCYSHILLAMSFSSAPTASA